VQAGAAAVGGGKRLRGRFCIAGWRAVEEHARPSSSGRAEPTSDVIGAAAALEIFHAAALVHDDIIDNSDTRRGRPAAHRALESDHRARGWAGDAAAFGRSGAILLGDLLVAWSDDILEEALIQASPRRAAAARADYATMRREVTIGQFLDIAEESAYRSEPDDRHAERALRVASLKSARYSIQQPLAIGASLAGADDAQSAALAEFGHPVGDPALDAEQIAFLQRTIVDTGALDRVEQLIADYSRTAERALSGARLGNAAVGELRDLARAATVRTT
jgi:geranylgeranyl diphosphate synthase type I